MIYLNSKPINVTLFSDNTSQVWKLDELSDSTADIRWEFEHEGEFLHLAQLKMLLDIYKYNNIKLYIPYFPYARQDKIIGNETTFSLYTFCRLLDSLNFNSIETLDIHSKIPYILLDNFVSYPPDSEILKVLKQTNPNILAFPDQGARDRYIECIPSSMRKIYANKTRDQETGKILNIECNEDVNDRKILIIDDICDGGGTFCGLSKILYKNGAKQVDLYVTHGIFSNGLTPLRESGIIDIFTKDGKISEVQGNIVYDRI